MNLQALSKLIEGVKYDKHKHNALVWRVKSPFKFTAQIFASGSVTLCGINSEENVEEAAKYIADALCELGLDVKARFVRIHNVAGTLALGHCLDLPRMRELEPLRCSLEPELFPALVYSVKDSKERVLCFHTGKLIFTGCKSSLQLFQLFNKISLLLSNGKKN